MEQSDVRQNKAELHMRPFGRPCNYARVELQQHWAAGLHSGEGQKSEL